MSLKKITPDTNRTSRLDTIAKSCLPVGGAWPCNLRKIFSLTPEVSTGSSTVGEFWLFTTPSRSRRSRELCLWAEEGCHGRRMGSMSHDVPGVEVAPLFCLRQRVTSRAPGPGNSTHTDPSCGPSSIPLTSHCPCARMVTKDS